MNNVSFPLGNIKRLKGSVRVTLQLVLREFVEGDLIVDTNTLFFLGRKTTATIMGKGVK